MKDPGLGTVLDGTTSLTDSSESGHSSFPFAPLQCYCSAEWCNCQVNFIFNCQQSIQQPTYLNPFWKKVSRNSLNLGEYESSNLPLLVTLS